MRLLRWGLIGILLLFALMQLVPYGRSHDNPPVTAEPAWDARTAELARDACMDCHSNETVWPWYSNVAPASWLLQRDVDKGREDINFSEWGPAIEEADELGEVVREGEMPPWFYLPLHREASLSAAEKQELAEGLEKIAPPEASEGSDGSQGDDD